MTDATTKEQIESRPYNPSWIDRFTHWVETLSVPSWMFYILFGIGLVMLQVLFLWLDRGLQAKELLPVIIFNGFAVPFILALLHLLDNQAVIALNAMRPTLDTTDQEFDQCKYQLANMPFLPPLIAGLIMTVLIIFTPLVTIEPIRYAALEQLPVFAVVYHIVDKISGFLIGVFLYHTIRQLRLVSTINLDHVRINLFHLGPLQAFSRLTASTSVGLVVFSYLWILINPELLTDPVNLGLAAIFMIVSLSLFVWPLYGVHRLMEVEKARALRDIDLHFEAVFSKFNQRLRKDDFAEIEMLNGIISSLDTQRRRVEAIPTWPWSPETARIVLTTIALPLMLMLLGFIVEKAFGT